MEVVVTTDVSASDEPLLAVVVGSGEKYINQFLSYPTTGGNSNELALIGKLCMSARELCEHELNKSLAPKTITVFYSPEDAKRDRYNIKLPYGPHKTITASITYSDGTEALSLVENTDFYLSGNQYKTIHLPEINSSEGMNQISGYKIVIICGYNTSGLETIPESIKRIMADQVCQWYAKRDGGVTLSQETRKALQPFTDKLWI
jgi:uncharacterized phiE125 gp8 family phage protein